MAEVEYEQATLDWLAEEQCSRCQRHFDTEEVMARSVGYKMGYEKGFSFGRQRGQEEGFREGRRKGYREMKVKFGLGEEEGG